MSANSSSQGSLPICVICSLLKSSPWTSKIHPPVHGKTRLFRSLCPTCFRYFVVYLVDSALGTVLTLLFHRITIRVLKNLLSQRYIAITNAEEINASKTWSDFIVACGDYGNPPSIRAWTPQTIEWVEFFTPEWFGNIFRSWSRYWLGLFVEL